MSDRPVWINYVYVGTLFAFLILLSITSIMTKEQFGGSQIFFLLYSIGEAAFEVILFIITGWLIQRFLPKFVFYLFIAFTFICFLTHLIDFVLERIMNFTALEMIAVLFDETFENFLQMLEASGLPLSLWLACFALVAILPLIGVAIYRLTGWITQKKPLGLRVESLVLSIFCIPIALFLWDTSTSPFLDREAHQTFIKALPWKMTFLQPSPLHVALPSPLSPPQTEGEKKRILEEITLTPTARPNIYLFVIESLRKDVITPEIAPALALFRRQNIDCEMSLSNGNATHLSWFSLFHSNYPFYWSAVQKSGWSSGSPALQLLSKMGYKMRVYSSANLGYYGMDELIFGKNHHLASSFQTYPHMRPKPTWKSDVETIDAFEQDSLDPDLQSGQCFVFFWDATHFDYSWPKESPPRFFPFASELNYFKAYQSQENIASIKNRYKNAVHFIDTLFARFLTLAPKDSIIVVAGDHGEEFFEQGRLFHLSALNNVQTEVPLFCQLPRKPATIPKLMTQMDLFPTIIDAITTDGATSGLLEGESLFLKERWPYAVLARYNASRSPCEFCLHNGRHKIIARFENTKDIFRSRSFKVLSLRTHCDRIFCECKRDPQGWIQSEFAGAIERLFQAEVKN